MTEEAWELLHQAFELGDTEGLQSLLVSAADFSSADQEGNNLYHLAALYDAHWAIPLIKELQLDPNHSNIFGFTPLMSCCSSGHIETFSALQSIGAKSTSCKSGLTALHLAAAHGHVHIISKLLEDPIHLNTRDEFGEGFTPLMYACQEGHQEVVKMLLDAGADPTIVDANGYGPIHTAAAQGQLDIAKWLLEFGASPDTASKHSGTPLSLACAYGNLEIVTLLIKYGVDTKAKDADGHEPIYYAREYGHIDIAELLSRQSAE